MLCQILHIQLRSTSLPFSIQSLQFFEDSPLLLSSFFFLPRPRDGSLCPWCDGSCQVHGLPQYHQDMEEERSDQNNLCHHLKRAWGRPQPGEELSCGPHGQAVGWKGQVRVVWFYFIKLTLCRNCFCSPDSSSMTWFLRNLYSSTRMGFFFWFFNTLIFLSSVDGFCFGYRNGILYQLE